MSPVRQVFTDIGDWNLALNPNTPRSILSLCDLDTYGFSRLVITPLHIPTHAITVADLLTVARYTGVLRTLETDQRSAGEPPVIGGVHIAVMLGDEDGKGNNFENAGTASAYPRWNNASNSWLKSVLDRGNGITQGTFPTAAASPTRDLVFDGGDTARRLLDQQVSQFGAPYHYWRVNPDGTLDVGQRSTLWRSGEVAVLPGGGGRDGSLIGLNPTRFAHSRDVEDWTSAVRVNLSSVTETGTATIGSNPYVDIAGNALTMRRFISSDKASSATSAGNIAAGQLARFDETRRQLDLAVTGYDVGAYIEPGDEIYVYDPDQDLLDLSNQVSYRGQTIFPLEIRTDDLTWPVQQGMGVYLLTGATPDVTDLTPYVLPETGATRIGVGAFARTLAP